MFSSARRSCGVVHLRAGEDDCARSVRIPPLANCKIQRKRRAESRMEHGTGRKYLSTAGHCGNGSVQYNGTYLTFKDEYFGGSRDVQWHNRMEFTLRNRVYTGLYWAPYRTITGTKGRSNQVVGDNVCRKGTHTTSPLTARENCTGIIDSRNFRPYITGGPFMHATFIRAKADGGCCVLSVAGDSGGPWYKNGKAYGTTFGHTTTTDAIYMPINYLAGTGVAVWTGGI